MKGVKKSDLRMIRFLIVNFIIFHTLSVPVNSQEFNYSGELTQGGLVRGKVVPGTKIFLDEKQIKVSRNGLFVFGFGRDHS